MHLLYNRRDWDYAERRGDLRLRWLCDVGAIAIQDLAIDGNGFLFGYQIPRDEFAAVRDSPEDREQLARLEDILSVLNHAHIDVPMPRTWVLRIDDPPPPDMTYPLFVRTSTSSWKRGGQISKVRSLKELQDECVLLRRAFRWDATILAREWINLSSAGQWRYGSIPVEIRVWIVDSIPFAWSFHYLGVAPIPKGLPPSPADLKLLTQYAQRIALPFSSRLIVADFVRDTSGNWHFLEAGPGACAGTAHQSVFKAVASKLSGREFDLESDRFRGRLPIIDNDVGVEPAKPIEKKVSGTVFDGNDSKKPMISPRKRFLTPFFPLLRTFHQVTVF